MKKLLQRASVISALALSLLPASGALATHASAPHGLSFVEHAVNDKAVNIFKGVDKRGNYLVFNNPVFDSADKTQIGQSSGSCVYTTNATQECTWSVNFAKGSLSFEGTEPVTQTPFSYTNAVIGGTGVYKGAAGEAMIKVFKNATGVTEYEYTVTLK